MSDLKPTPLWRFHERHRARMGPFAGWNMPIQYSSILEEHRAVRENAGMFDVSHMGEITVEGPEAKAFLQKLVTNDIDRVKVGQAQYNVMCDGEGKPIDDLIVYCRGDDKYFLCVNASNRDKDFEWMQKVAGDFDCEVNDVSDAYGLIALQGPKAETITSMVLTWPDLKPLKRFHFIEREWSGIPVIASRTGYTGEDGFEIYIPAESAEIFAETLLTAGIPHGIALCGLGARDSLRLEAGYPLYGHELSEEIDPLTAGLSWVVKLAKEPDFNGKAKLKSNKDQGLKRKVAYFRMKDRRIAREGATVLQGDREVGRVLSGSHSPILNAPIGSVLIETDSIEKGGLSVDLRGKRFELEILQPPLQQYAVKEEDEDQEQEAN
ncbi:MAG: glycine cleavage system aminomethyltransferase GcvT [Opitutales bacterium]|nr:glycine cleavage system aminomethyltransferase GcvT [Opitutales bacterium]